MKLSKKLLSLLLCAIMVLGSVAVGGEGLAETLDTFSIKASAASSGTCGDNLTWNLSDDGVLTISGTGGMRNYSYFFDCPWYSYHSSIKTVIIENGVTSIGDWAFYDCGLTSVTILDSVTSIGSSAFEHCTGLTSITIPDSVTSVGESAFKNCFSLASVKIGNGVTSIGKDTFNFCSSLTSVTIPNSVTSIDYGAFESCKSLTSVTIGNGVTIIGDNAFFGCTGLTNITIPDSVKGIGSGAFFDCENLTNVTIGNSVTNIGGGAFTFCNNITNIIVDPDNKYYSNDSFGVLFSKDKTELIKYPAGNARTSYTIPNSVTSIGTSAFLGCANLTNVTIGNSVTSIGESAFMGCEKLPSITIPNSVTNIGGAAFMSCTKFQSITIPNSVKGIGDLAFSDCTSLEYVHIPVSVTTIGSSILLITSAYICSDTENCYAKTYADANGIEFKLCEGHGTVHVHTYTSSVKKPATCKEEGVMSYTCECGDSYTETISKAAHTPKDVTIPATCKQTGAKYTVCEVCGDTIGEIAVLPLAAHSFGEWTVSKKVTCLVDGEEQRSCSACEKTETKVITAPGSHIPGEWETVAEATTAADGKRVIKCTKCGEVIEEEILPKIPVKTAEDENTGIALDYPDIYGGDLTLDVEEAFDGAAFNLVNTQSTAAQCAVFDVKMLLDGVETQPDGKVTVRIPLPQGYDPERTFVYHVNTETGALDKMNARYETGFMVFETDHFSYYAVVEIATANTKIKAAPEKTIDYRSIVTIKASATDVPEGYRLAIYLGSQKVAEGDNKSVSYEYGELKSDLNYSVKVIDANGKVQKDSNGNELSKDSKITINAGFFKKLIAFFKGLFKSLPKVEVKP